jgi:hypothetical protein
VKTNILFIAIMSLCCQLNLVGQEKIFHEKHALRFELGSGFGDLFWQKTDDSYSHGSTTKDLHFKSWPSFQTNIAYAFKVDFIEFEVKLGYTFSSYFYSYTKYGGAGDFTTTLASGTMNSNRLYLQPIGFNFGKERSWGNFFGGAYLRWKFAESQNTNGISITNGNRWTNGEWEILCIQLLN